MSGKAIVDGMTFPSNFQSKPFCNNHFEKSRSSTTAYCLGYALATWLLPGQPVAENENFLFHGDIGQMYNISFSFHSFLSE